MQRRNRHQQVCQYALLLMYTRNALSRTNTPELRSDGLFVLVPEDVWKITGLSDFLDINAFIHVLLKPGGGMS
jgi:hypothetical protein